MKVPKVPRLPHTSRLRRWKSHACHVEDSRRPWVHRRRRASADIYEGTESATPATHIAPAVLKVSRLPRRRQSASMGPPSSPSFRGHLWRYQKCHACHTHRAGGAESVTPATNKTVGVHGPTVVAELPRTSMKVPKVPRLPHTSRRRCWKCHACHEQDSRRPWVHRRRRASADIYEGTESATPATQIESEQCCVLHACHVEDSRRPWVHRRRRASADIYEGTKSATPATQIESEQCCVLHACHVEDSRRPWVHRRRRASADIYEGTESATPATHIAPAVLKVSRLPRRRQSASMGPPSSPSFRGHLWRYQKCHACHTHRAGGAESVTPAT